MDRDAFGRWLEAYFAAWVSNEPDDVAALFTEDATYAVGPFADVWEGRDEIVRRWTSGAQEDVEYALRGPCRRGRDRHRALERQGPVRGRAAPRRMGRDPADHVRAGRALSRSSRVARPPGAARRLRTSPTRTSAPTWHSSTCRARRQNRNRPDDARTTRITRHDRSRNTTVIGTRIPNVWTDRHRSNSIAPSRPGDRPRSPRARSRRVVGASARHRPPRGPTTKSVRIGANVAGSRRHPNSWAWQDSNPRHEG